ncbi:MAG TPA: DUF6088 family protein [Sphingomicrobium sp.]|jgi:hypothetical protein|nr:DUF6088 family protein [Sphingomicrobium sp.]
MQDLKDLIISRIKGGPQNSVWTAADFLDLGSRDAVDKALQRLIASNEIRRIDRGLYDRPGDNPLTKRSNPPDPRRVIDAVARRDQIRILVDGITAANDLGLTNAVPAKIVVHTDARLRPIKLGNLTISFKPTAPSKLFWAGRPAMRTVQALHWLRDVLGDPEENRRVTNTLRRLFENGEAGRNISEDLREGLSSLPSWMQDFLRPLLGNETEIA